MATQSRYLLLRGVMALLCAGALLSADVALAQVPAKLTHQGRLLDDSGAPLSGDVEMTFSIYDAASGGAILWQGSYTVEADANGYYSVELGSADNPIDETVLAGANTWVSINVEGTDLEPRMALNSVPYAVVAGQAQTVAAGSVDSEALSDDFALPADQVGGVSWDKLSDVPQGLSDGDDDTLNGLSCTAEQTAVFDGSSWSCETLPTYDGRDFAIADQACQPGQIVTGIDSSGRVVCATDANSTYSAGAGLSLGGDTFSLDTSVTDSRYVQNDQICPTGKVAVGTDTSGALQCTPDQDTDTTYSAGSGLALNSETFSLDTSVTDARYVQSDGDTLSGDLSTTGDITADGDIESNGSLQVGNTSVRIFKLRVGRDSNDTIKFVAPDNSLNTLTISDTSASQMGSNGRIAYSPGNLYFNIEGAPLSCTLLHSDDDIPDKSLGLYFATDSGNSHQSVWGNSTTATFILRREGSNSIPLEPNANYHLLCM